MATLRSQIAGEVHKLVRGGSAAAKLALASGDHGLIPEGSVAWAVHGDFATMMTGGVAALLLQMLHPSALAGVWDHSNFRRDTQGRLKRTAQYIAATTFAGRAVALDQVALVRRIHDHVHGTLPDGTPYSANDPALLTFVHVAGASRFLAAYIRYRDPRLSWADQDRYYAETAVVARALGAEAVPETRRGIEAYMSAIRPHLAGSDRSREVATALLAPPPGTEGAALAANRLMVEAGIDLLPDWAAAAHGLSIPAYRRPLVRAGAMGTGAVLRWALAGER